MARAFDEMYILTTRNCARNYIYKIGTSLNTPKQKLVNINDDDLYICHMAKCFDASSVESRLHTFLHTFRLQNKPGFFVIQFKALKELMDQLCKSSIDNYNECMELINNFIPPPNENSTSKPASSRER